MCVLVCILASILMHAGSSHNTAFILCGLFIFQSLQQWETMPVLFYNVSSLYHVSVDVLKSLLQICHAFWGKAGDSHTLFCHSLSSHWKMKSTSQRLKLGIFREEVRVLNEELNYCLLCTDSRGDYAPQFKPKLLISLLHPHMSSKLTLYHTLWICTVIMGFSSALIVTVFWYGMKCWNECREKFLKDIVIFADSFWNLH